MKDWMTYEKIQELKRNHLNKSQVSRRLHIDYKTVTKYWDMSPDAFSTCRNRAQRRKRKADVYKDFIVGCLQKYPDMTAAQIYAWIKERTGLKKLPFRQRSAPPHNILRPKRIHIPALRPDPSPFSVEDLLKAHKMMMNGLVPENGKFRSGGVGIFDGEVLIHMAPPAEFVPEHIHNLFTWYQQSELHLLMRFPTHTFVPTPDLTAGFTSIFQTEIPSRPPARSYIVMGMTGIRYVLLEPMTTDGSQEA